MRKQLIHEAMHEGYYDNAKQIVRLGAKLWEAAPTLKPLKESPRMPDFTGKTISSLKSD